MSLFLQKKQFRTTGQFVSLVFLELLEIFIFSKRGFNRGKGKYGLSQFDPKAQRVEFLEIDDMVEQIDDLVRFSDWTKDELVTHWMCHGYITKMDWKGLSMHTPKSGAVSLREVSDTSLVSTCRNFAFKSAVDFFRELAQPMARYCGDARKAEW